MGLPQRHWRLPLFVFGALFLPLSVYVWWATGWYSLGWGIWAGAAGLAVFSIVLPLVVRTPDFLSESIHYVDFRRYSGTRTQAFCECGWTGAMRRTVAGAEQDRDEHLKAAKERADRR
jgi:hypothetical protein